VSHQNALILCSLRQGYCYGCPVAIKVIRANSGGNNAKLLEGFKEEVKLMR
jgi:hypothetical protein